jgi:hypothetical protein
VRAELLIELTLRGLGYRPAVIELSTIQIDLFTQHPSPYYRDRAFDEWRDYRGGLQLGLHTRKCNWEAQGKTVAAFAEDWREICGCSAGVGRRR